MRKYVRHPIDVPIALNPSVSGTTMRLTNYGHGGLCCAAPHWLDIGTEVDIDIPMMPPYRGRGVIAWCRPGDGHYDVGIEFATEDEAFASRMAEQICQIEVYRKRVQDREGRELSLEDAAREWIGKYAKYFPRTGTGA